MTSNILIDEVNYVHYTRLHEINLDEGAGLIAFAQIETSCEDRSNTFNVVRKQVRSVLIQSLRNGELPFTELHEFARVMDDSGIVHYSLKEIAVKIIDLCEWAGSKGYDLPPELRKLVTVTAHEKAEVSCSQISTEKTLRPNQTAKAKCQAIAKTLWHNYPDLTTAEIIKRHEILEFGDGKMYPGKNTLRDWVSEVDPRPDSEKTGPKKATE